MSFSRNNGVRFYSFDIFPRAVKQAVFTRQGGVSPAPWDTLNVGGTVGDDAARVRENRARSFAALGRAFNSLFDVWQVHSADVVYADAPRPSHVDHFKADIILTDKPEVTLYMRFQIVCLFSFMIRIKVWWGSLMQDGWVLCVVHPPQRYMP
jgi:hypothetical protein